MERQWVRPHAFLSARPGRAGSEDLAVRRVVLPHLPSRRPRAARRADFVSGDGLTGTALDASSNSVFFLAYDAFGNPLNYDPATTFDSHLYSGEQTDSTGLQWLRSRYYDPRTGHFLSFDAYWGNIQDPQSLHKYVYCYGDGVNHTDPTGQFIDLLLGAADGRSFRRKERRPLFPRSATPLACKKLVSVYETVVGSYAEIGFKAAAFLVRSGPVVQKVTTISGLVFVASSIQLVCEEAGFVPRTGYTEFVFALHDTFKHRNDSVGNVEHASRHHRATARQREWEPVVRIAGGGNHDGKISPLSRCF